MNTYLKSLNGAVHTDQLKYWGSGVGNFDIFKKKNLDFASVFRLFIKKIYKLNYEYSFENSGRLGTVHYKTWGVLFFKMRESSRFGPYPANPTRI